MDASEVIERLGLHPHPEGGWYAETWRADAESGERPSGSAIYFLLRRGEQSQWHRVDAAETWHFYAGEPLELRIAAADAPSRRVILGTDLARDMRPPANVPPGVHRAWRSR